MVSETTEDIQQCVAAVLQAIPEEKKEKVTEKDIEKDIHKLLEYGVPLTHAQQTLIKKYGASGTTGGISQSSERVLLVDLKPNESSVHILGRVVSVNSKEVQARGQAKTIHYGLLRDESGTIPFTAWIDIDFDKGDVIDIQNAYTKEWQGAVQINFGDRTHIAKTDDNALKESTVEPREYKVADLRAGLNQVDITVKILDINQREVTVNDTKKKVYSGIIGDETGKAQFTSWHDFKLKKDDIVQITGGYIRSWKGIPQLTFDENAKVSKKTKHALQKKEIGTQKLLLHELVERHGALDVEVNGTVIDIRQGSGVIVRCPECNRVLQNNECSIHGKVEGLPDLRLKLTVDDGTGAVNAIVGKQQTEKLLGTTFEKLQKNGTNITELQQALFGHRLKMTGNALGDPFGVTLIAQTSAFDDVDVTAETDKLKKELEDI